MVLRNDNPQEAMDASTVLLEEARASLLEESQGLNPLLARIMNNIAFSVAVSRLEHVTAVRINGVFLRNLVALVLAAKKMEDVDRLLQ